MSLAVRHPDFISEQEYLEAEERAEVRHEYVNGFVFLKDGVQGMAGGTRQHATLSGNIFAALHAALRGKRCRPYVENMKLRVQRGEAVEFFYPDVMVVCQPSGSNVWEDAPRVIFEVLSEGTERTDRIEKRDAYLGIPSLSAYVVLDSRRLDAVVFRRVGGEWKTEAMQDSAGVIDLPEIESQLPLAMLYEGVF